MKKTYTAPVLIAGGNIVDETLGGLVMSSTEPISGSVYWNGPTAGVGYFL